MENLLFSSSVLVGARKQLAMVVAECSVGNNDVAEPHSSTTPCADSSHREASRLQVFKQRARTVGGWHLPDASRPRGCDPQGRAVRPIDLMLMILVPTSIVACASLAAGRIENRLQLIAQSCDDQSVHGPSPKGKDVL
jgi:hypothetical protein